MSKRILFIDDQIQDWENILKIGLEPFGFEIKGEEDPDKALKQIESFKPDIVLLDILFGDQLLGKTILEKIKRKYSDLPVMMLTQTMEASDYRSEDYILADFRYAKSALADGDFNDLAIQLDRLIERSKRKRLEKEDVTGLERFGFIVGQTKAMKEIAEIVEKIADQDQTVFITGEPGTGKELVAKSIHRLSSRRDKDFVTVVCAALPKELLESELFGHEKGAFTGAISQRKGKFEVAGEGTIFLDEIGEIPLDTQVKLLRFLQEKQFERVGGNLTLTSKARIIAATNQDPKELIKKGKFREDLYYRLNVVTINIPPLRERKEDIPLFFEYFVKKISKETKKKISIYLREDVKKMLMDYSWPGNIREMENVIRRAIALADENILQVINFSELNEKETSESKLSSNITEIVDRIYKKEITWADICKEFGAQGLIRKKVLLKAIDRWLKEKNKRPSSEELAELIRVSPNNMRRILSEADIKLTKLK